jgi:hypothetical protein
MFFFKIIFLLLLFAFRVVVRTVIGTVFAIIAPCVALVMTLSGGDFEKFCEAYEEWMLTGEIKHK